MKIEYTLDNAGWADATTSHDGIRRDMAVSYLSDALGDMAAAAMHLLRGSREISFSFQTEPGEHRWILTRGATDSLCIRILWFERTFSNRRDSSGTAVFCCNCTVLDFVGQVSHVLQNILSEVGSEEYKRRWKNHEFPLETFRNIQMRLAPQAD